ncbi:MAG: glycosyltransferase [Saprospiraceae bacterium]
MKLVVVTSRFPYPLEKGDKLRLYFQIKYLAQRHEITLLSLADEPVSDNSLQHIQSFCKTVYLFPINKNNARWSAIKSLLGKTPLEVSYFYNQKIKQKFEKIIHQIQPDHIFCQLIRMSEYVRHLPFPKTLDYMDAFSIGMQRRAENSNPILKAIFQRDSTQIADYESFIYQKFNNHIIISEQDKQHLSFLEKDKIHVLPNGVNTHFFAPIPEIEKKYDIAFVGNMGYYPNVQAALFLAKKIFPKLQIKFPKIKLLIAGARPTQEVKNLASENIKVTGWVEDIRTAYASANIFVAPIFYGRGQQNKILEAMSMGIPCITSDQVNKAIGAKNGTSILIANDEKSCQEQISLLLNNKQLQQKLSANGLNWIRSNFSWEKYGKQLEDLIVRTLDVEC